MSTILYARVSTVDQNIAIQKAHAESAGFVIDEVVADEGQSGVSTKLVDRPQGKRLFDKLRKGDTLVVRWVDRLGRNYKDVTENIRHFIDKGVTIRTVTNKLTFDGATTDPMQAAVRDAMIAFLAASAQAQIEATQEAQKAGIANAKADPKSYRGKKPSFDHKKLETVRNMLAMGAGTSEAARAAGLSRQTVLRIKADPAAAEAMLTRWEN